MSAKKLGRFAGLVFVLVAVFGGMGVASAGEQHAEASASTVRPATSAVQSGTTAAQMSNLSIEWD